MSKSLYDILGITPNATAAEIEHASENLKSRLAGPNAPPDAKIRLIAVSEAYQVLSDPTRKSLYDLRRLSQQQENQAHYELPLTDTPILIDHTRDALKQIFRSGRIMLALALLAAVLIYGYNLQAHRKEILAVANKIHQDAENRVRSEESRLSDGNETPEERSTRKAAEQKKREDDERLRQAERQQREFHSELNRYKSEQEALEREKEYKRREKERQRQEQERMAQNDNGIPQRSSIINYVP